MFTGTLFLDTKDHCQGILTTYTQLMAYQSEMQYFEVVCKMNLSQVIKNLVHFYRIAIVFFKMLKPSGIWYKTHHFYKRQVRELKAFHLYKSDISAASQEK